MTTETLNINYAGTANNGEYSIIYVETQFMLDAPEIGLTFEVWEEDVDSQEFKTAYDNALIEFAQTLRAQYEAKFNGIVNIVFEGL